MRKKLAMKICAVAMSVAMVGALAGCGDDSTGSSDSGSGSSTEEDSQGGQNADDASDDDQSAAVTDGDAQIVRVYGGNWNKLDPDSQDDNTVYLNAAALVEQKYNIKLVYSKPAGYEGYSQHEYIINALNNNDENCVDILSADMDAAVTLMGGGYVEDITADVDKLQIGSLYTDAASWGGHCYGLTFDNIGDTYMLIYSRKYLQDIGMDVTPTDKFMAGEWSYDECLAYLKELQSKLPDNTYAIGVHYFHWACMAPAANGVPGVSSDGHLGILDEAYIEAMEFYNTLIAEGVAAPITFGYDDDGNINAESLVYGTGSMGEGTSESPGIVITRVEMWELSGLEDKIGEFGIAFWPWGSNVTCEGDYTTLSDNYYTAQAYWGPTFIVKDAPVRTGIDAITLLQIALDYYEAADPVGVTAMREAWNAEQAGLTPEIGFEAGTMRQFCTEDDKNLYDWGHTRVTYDWSKSFDDGDIVNIWMNAAYIIDTGDGRAHGESYYQQGYQNMKDLGLVD